MMGDQVRADIALSARYNYYKVAIVIDSKVM